MKSFYSIITCAAVSLAVSVSAQTATTLTTPKQAIEPGRLGRVKVDGDNWQARARHPQEAFMIGQRVRIHSYDSIILTVESIK